MEFPMVASPLSKMMFIAHVPASPLKQENFLSRFQGSSGPNHHQILQVLLPEGLLGEFSKYNVVYVCFCRNPNVLLY